MWGMQLADTFAAFSLHPRAPASQATYLLDEQTVIHYKITANVSNLLKAVFL